ncbi:alkaline phosphatase family protein [Plantactinospora sp. CA-290183]|uniref:alkaline phosphatase family protein n=1 Tax=Plantactinospora sp. CA-290183 TaxID=3240006 RepID=UPI003D941464
MMGPLHEVRPRYHGGSLSDVLPSALAVLGVSAAAAPATRAGRPGPLDPLALADPLGLTGPLAGVRRIAVLLVDGLGWHQLPVAAPYAPTLADLAVRFGRPLTSGFPSTTPTSLVSFGTGAAPGVHGVLGFRVNVPGTDRLLTHIDWPGSPAAGPGFPGGGPASPVGGHRPGGSWPTTDVPAAPDRPPGAVPGPADRPPGEPPGPSGTVPAGDPEPRHWQPLPTQLERARAAGVAVTVVSRPEFATSGLSLAAYGDVGHRGAAEADTLVREMLAALTSGDGPTLVYGYHPDVDRHGHLGGVGSADWCAAVAVVDAMVDRLVAGLPSDAALLVTADHGQLDIPPEARFDLDTDPRLRAGVRVVAGEARVRYLHTVPGATADVLATWSEVLGTAARVVTRDELVAAGWFGPVPEAHLRRIGDVAAVCLGTSAVVASVESPIEAGLVALHGSSTSTEMTIPLLVVR